MKMSEMLIPTSRNKPAKVKDSGLIRFIQAGYGLWNPNSEVLMLMPLGVKMKNIIEKNIINSLKEISPQAVDCRVPEGAMAVAVRQLKRSIQLPMVFSESKNDHILELQGYGEDVESIRNIAGQIFRSLGVSFSDLGLNVHRWNEISLEGERCRIVTRGERGDLSFEEGLSCDCGWSGAINSPISFGGNLDAEEEKLTEVHTPGVGTIEALCGYLSVSPENTVKTMCYADPDGVVFAALIRGDRRLSIEKVEKATGRVLHSATDEELSNAMGDLAGYLGPIGIPETVRVIADQSVVNIKNGVVGANKKDYHMTGACWGRDFSADVADLSVMMPGDRCPACGEPLKDGGGRSLLTLELWNKWADQEKSLTFVNEKREKCHPVSWVMQVNLTALLVSLFDSDGSLSIEASPVKVQILPCDEQSISAADDLYRELKSERIEVLLDDRAGKLKGAEADLVSMKAPWAVTLSDVDGSTDFSVRKPDGTVSKIDRPELLKLLV